MATNDVPAADSRQATYEQAHRRVLRDAGYLPPAAMRAAVMDVLWEAAAVDAAFHGVEVVTVGQAAIEAAWDKLPRCDRTLCAGPGDTDPDFGLRGHHEDCPRGRAIRQLRPLV